MLEVPATTAAQVQEHVDAARFAGAAWRRRSAAQRAEALDRVAAALHEAAEELAALVVREVGKTVAEARAEVTRTVSILRYFAQQALDPFGEMYPPSAGGLLFTRRNPHGVAALITPWNFPLAIPAWKAAPALAVGNAVVLKPAPAASATALRLGEIFATALPEGLLHIVPGDADTGTALVASADCVSFTGSTRVGIAVTRAAVNRGVPVQAEMGGQNAAIVFADADPVRAAEQIATGAFSYSGQKCTATRRIILVGDCDEFVDTLILRTESLAVGDPADAGTDVGPLITVSARSAVNDAIAAAESAGGRFANRRAEPPTDGYYVAPALVEGLPDGHPLLRDEVFGPVSTILRAPDERAALQIANSTRYGLVAAVHTSDLDRALRLADELECGVIKVNAPTSGVDFHLPFGGDKTSSFGPREQGKAARDFYTHSRTVAITPAAG